MCDDWFNKAVEKYGFDTGDILLFEHKYVLAFTA